MNFRACDTCKTKFALAWWNLKCKVMTLVLMLFAISVFLSLGSLYIWNKDIEENVSREELVCPDDKPFISKDKTKCTVCDEMK